MLFGLTEPDLVQKGAEYTAREIAQQPAMWLETLDIIRRQKDGLQAFIEQITGKRTFDVLMVGAGTSNYVGESVSQVLNARLPFRIRSCGSTDLVVEPEKYLTKTTPTLLVSFARSGNSPESIGAVDMANQVCQEVFHLFITCNSQGALAGRAKGQEHCWSLELPPQTNDQGFAMTSSFSCMYLAALTVFQLDRLSEIQSAVKTLCTQAAQLIDHDWVKIKRVVDDFDFDRVVYLGTGVLHGVAQESALKMLELNAGKVATFFESPLGFRHGPKSIISDQTLTVFYLSSDPYIRRYEMDLVKELSGQRHKNRLLATSGGEDPQIDTLVNEYYVFSEKAAIEDAYTALLDVVGAQILALLKSLKNGIKPDDPCPTGEVNRVVKGVTIYPYSCCERTP